MIKIADGSTVACHDSEAQAQAQLRALYASEPAAKQTYAVELADLLETLAVDFGDDDESLTEYLTEFDVSRLPPQLHAYWLGPKGSARVGGWGAPGSWTKCTVEMRKEGVPGRMIKGLCANLYHEATGHTPNQKHLSEEAMEELDLDDYGAHLDEFADAPTLPYGDVKYADPGYQGDNRKRYPIDTPKHIRAAWSYINMPKNAGKYSPEQLKAIKAKIQKAMSGSGGGAQASVIVVSAAKKPDIPTTSKPNKAGACPPGTHKMPDGSCMDDTDMQQTYADETLAQAPAPADEPWSGILTVEGAESGDGRIFSLGSLDWAQLPLPLMYQPTNVGGHNGSIMVGEITQAARKGSEIAGWGHVSGEALAGEHGDGIRQMMDAGGVSVDVDKVKDADVEMIYADEEAAGGFMAKPETTIFHRGRIRGATLVAFPAFVEAKLHFDNQVTTASADVDCGCDEVDEDEPLTAAAHTITIPDLPKASWFDRPTDVKMYGALTVTDEGRVFGRLAPANVTHRAVKRRVPMKTVDYSRWMNKETIVEGGDRVVTGVITMNCGHAATENYGTLVNRKEHYDNSCSIAANVRIGEDADGVWVAGALRHGVTSEQVSTMMGCQLSGDWQPHPDRPGVTEFIAALLVPVPGFPQARTAPSVTYTDGVLSASAVPIRLGIAEEPDPVQTAFEAIRFAKQVLVASLGIEVDPKVRKESIMAELSRGN